jgi:hypothetical protein
MPPEPSTIGSTMRAATSLARAARSRSNAATTSASTGSGRRATSNSFSANGSVKRPRALTLIAPKVSPW